MSKPVADTLPNSPPPRRGGGLLAIGVVLVLGSLLGLVAVLCLGGIGLLFMFTGTASGPSSVPFSPSGYSAGTPSAAGTGPVSVDGVAPVGATPDEIESLPPGSWHNLLSTPPTPLTDFDAFQGIDWATGLARRWRKDAVLVRVDVDHQRLAGPMDLINDADAQVDYRFFSPGQFELAVAAAEVSETEVPTGFRLWLEEGQIRAMITDVDPPTRQGKLDPRYKPFTKMAAGCTQAKLVTVAMSHPKTPRRPAYDFGMRWRFDRAYVIDVDPGDAYIDPSTCAIWKR